MTINHTTESEIEVECKRLREELKKTQHHLQCVNDVVRDISSLLDLDQILAVVAEKARQLIGAGQMIVPIVDEDRQIYSYLAASGKNSALILGQSFPLNVGMCGWVLSNRQPLYFGEGSQSLMGKNVAWAQGMESALLVPLMSRGNIVGGLSGLGKEGGGSFTQEDQSLLELFAWHISVVIENAMIFKQLKNHKFQSQSILDNTPAIIYIKDTAGKFLLINKQHEKLFKFSNQDIKGKTDYDVFSHEVAEKFVNNDQQVLKNKLPVEFEEKVDQADGEHVYISAKFPLFDINNKIYAICSISTDITEHRKTEAVLRRAQKMEAIGQLSGGIAHDFNNQLGVVIGYLDMINHAVGTQAGVARMVEIATRATMRCTDLTRQLLSFSRKQINDDKKLDLNECFIEMNMLFMRSLTPKVSIEYDVPVDLWPIRTNKGELQDAMLNIVLNAGDAMAAGGRLTIMARNVWLDEAQVRQLQNITTGPYVKLTVSDTGTGMSAEVLEKIYEPFFTTKPVGKGTGLGMAMVYGFVKRNNGLINIYSESGVGTSVNIYLPMTLAENVAEVESANYHDAIVTGNEKILVVDDEPALLELTVQYLKELGYDVVSAGHAHRALDIIKSSPDIQLLLTDVIMPDMNGYQLAKQAQAMNPAIKVLLVSGFVGNKIMDESYTRYETNILLKPFRKDVLIRKVREILDKDCLNE